MRPRLSYANVVSSIALFLVLTGGAAYALNGSNTVFSDDIVNGEVKNADLAANAVASGKILDGQVKNPDLGSGASSSNTIADGGVRGIDVADNSLKGADIDEGSLVGGPGSPSGVAGGDLTGSYPNPLVRSNAVGSDEVIDGSLTGADLDPALVADLKDRCPSGMTRFGNTFCIDSTSRGSANWGFAADTCAINLMRLPTISEARIGVLSGVIGSTGAWTDVAYREEPAASPSLTVAVAAEPGQPGLTRVHALGANIATHCVTTPSNR